MDKTPGIVSSGPLLKKLPSFSSRGLAAAFVGGSLCVGSFIFATNTVALDWNKVLLQAKRNNAAVEPAPKLKTLLDKVTTDLKLSDSEKKSVKLFTSESDICEVFGTVIFPHGALLGLPETANAESVADITLDIKWEDEKRPKKITEKIERLKEVSVLSDAAKQFVIAEGLVLARDYNHFTAPALCASLCVLTSFVQGSLFSLGASIKKHPQMKGPVYLASFIMWACAGAFVSGKVKELQLREDMGHLSKEYVDGGVEFYEKLQQQLQLKKDLCGEEIANFFGSYYLVEIVSKRLSNLRKLQSKFGFESL
ncbi:uncharacterized protein LOC117648896 isoform X2 [Thrips palmi]|uniref:Uncharacterized protein LOC117648896 isoform X2 n=1 Tax=Thrips palmi TaxID=161013 RepID=A0A6P8Z459_THRPL|nr:uncharacterized protein LOC117648896 isoform X2 [Thrips palmi]